MLNTATFLVLTGLSSFFTPTAIPDQCQTIDSNLYVCPTDSEITQISDPSDLNSGFTLTSYFINTSPASEETESSTQAPSPQPLPTLSSSTPLENTNYDTSINLDPEVLFQLVNEYRQSLSLPPFEKEPRLCQLAQSRAPELQSEILGKQPMHAGFKNRQLEYRATENLIYQRSEQAALNWWLNSSIHRHSLESDNKYSCIACQGRTCSEVFSNFTPKPTATIDSL